MTITPEIAINWIRDKEPIAAAQNFHLGFTGSVLFKGKSTKDFDVIAYPHDPTMPFDKNALLESLGVTMRDSARENFRVYADKNYGRNVAVCYTETGLRVDILFMQ